MLAATKAFATFGRRAVDLGDPFWANVSLLLQPPSLAGGTNKQFVDSSANNLTVTAFGDVYQSADSPVAGGGSAVFDGSGDYLQPASSSELAFGTGDFTIELWFNADSVAKSPCLSDWRPYNSTPLSPVLFVNYQTSGKLSYHQGSGNVITGSTTIATNTWYHVAISRSSGVTKMFLNGIQEGSNYSDTNNYATTAPTFGALGYNPTLTDFQYDGKIADVRVVKGTALYTSNFTVPTAPLTAVSGTSLLLNMKNLDIADKSLQSNTISVVGDAQTSTVTPLDGMGSVTFDGNGDYLKPESGSEFAFATGDFTVEAWIRPTTWGSSYRAVFRQDNSPGIFLGANNGNLIVHQIGTGDLITTAQQPTTSTWSHIAVSRSGTSLRLFLNGTQVGSATNSTNFTDTTANVGGFSGAQNFNGQIADLRITKGVARYTEAFTPPTKPLPAVGPANQITALGGTITEAGGYRIHTFTSSGTFTVASNPKLDPVEYLVVGGGGAGGGYQGGGGGAGGLLTGTVSLSPGYHNVVVGAGGVGAVNSNGGNGEASRLAEIIAAGGGGGGRAYNGDGLSGGSGGGGGNKYSGNGGVGGAGTPGQGYAGGSATSSSTNYGSGGGGGAGGVGADAVGNGAAGSGGVGVASSISGSSVMYAGGGGGASYFSLGGDGGSGGGGNGATGVGTSPTRPATAGAANTGGGGGGGSASFNNYGASGGSGIVIIRYPI